MARNFKELQAKMTDESQARSREKAKHYAADMALDELREACEMTQVHLATILKVNQSAISKMERRTDMYVSTLQAMVKAMGGSLEIQAVFPEGRVRINQFGDLRKPAKLA